MHLKSLTMKGFKSFASATTLALEPGITCVVGPNGTGKSNVVDALTWVMGEQGATSLRGGKMEDVIFAGTASRPPLGRAEVALTIDNTDGALPIDYTEVTISRTMFRSGGSEYAINGQTARLLDVQELLSDSGLGREMHVIVGQGQLDSVLRATPLERRGFIEEAAGVLKHRKRKEKAVRKLDAMQANLTRLEDLTAEIRRQLGPLARQAETARRAAVIQAEVRDAKARLLADDLVQLTATLEAEIADESALLARKAEVEAELATVRTALAAAEADHQDSRAELKTAQDLHYGFARVQERLRGVASLARDRQRLLGSSAQEASSTGPDPQDLREQAERVRAEETELATTVTAAREALHAAVGSRGDAEAALADEDKRLTALARAAADRREGLARLSGQVSAAQSRVDAAEAEIGRLAEARAEAAQRAESATTEFRALESQVAGVEAGEEGLDAEHDAAQADAEQAQRAVDTLNEQLQSAETDRATWTARREALALGLSHTDGTQALLAAEDLPGVLGSLAALLQVRPGYEEAVAAALGQASDAVATADPGSAVDALRRLKDTDAGRAHLVIGGGSITAQPPAGLPGGAEACLHVLQAPERLRPVLADLLADVVVVDGLDLAQRVVTARPELTAVTRDGDLLSVRRAHGGSGNAPSVIQVQAAVDEAKGKAQQAAHRAEQARFALSAASTRLADATERVEAALERLHASDAEHAAVAEQLGRLGSAARSANAEVGRLGQRIDTVRAQLQVDRTKVSELTDRLTAAQGAGKEEDAEPDTAVRSELAERATAARTRETEARLALRTAEERLRGIRGRAESLEGAARREEEAREVAARRAARRAEQSVVAGQVLADAEQALTAVASRLHLAADRLAAVEAHRSDQETRITGARDRIDALGNELAGLTDTVHRDEVARAQQRLRIEQLENKAIEELGLQPSVLMDEFGPHQPVPPPPPAPGTEEPEPPPTAIPFVREEQEKRARRAGRALNQLGKVNPLALEEYAALEERSQFLNTQLEDLQRTRTDLLGIITEVDSRVEQVFTQAFHDTAREFEGVFSRLFPGGEGHLELTDPTDMLTTGIEVHARPAGKKVKRLSLLSGGERSLTAVALMVAIFRARPSPFYVLDEVEAALDDVNLGRLIDIMEELRDSSQLIVVTHQKRTMQIADALYGVTMRGDGVSAVISQRIRETVDA